METAEQKAICTCLHFCEARLTMLALNCVFAIQQISNCPVAKPFCVGFCVHVTPKDTITETGKVVGNPLFKDLALEQVLRCCKLVALAIPLGYLL